VTPDEAAEYQKLPKCTHCGGWHLRACPRVKRMVFSGDGRNVVEVEFWRPGEWPEDGIVWPEDVAEALAEADDAS
jgi:hypothetical protein